MYLSNGTLLQGGKYKIVRHISSGGFGNTYEAIDVYLDKRIAIKEFFVKDFCSRASETMLVTITNVSKKPLIEHLKKKFWEEARAIAKMEHDNIVKVQALFEENDTAYYVMDYIDGESVSALLKRRGSLSEAEALPIIRKVASALEYMHNKNCFHLDVKPANIMLRKDGKVVLIDFGSSKQYAEVDGENTTTLAPCYTPGYAPSEQMNPKCTDFTAATDVYSLGATLYKMLTGQTPPSAIDLLSGEEELSPLPMGISSNVRNSVGNALIPLRKKRTQTIKAFLGGIETAVPVDDDEETRLGEEALRAEEERKRMEEAERKRKEQERKEREEAKRKANEEAERMRIKEDERKRKEANNRNIILFILLVLVVIIVCIVANSISNHELPASETAPITTTNSDTNHDSTPTTETYSNDTQEEIPQPSLPEYPAFPNCTVSGSVNGWKGSFKLEIESSSGTIYKGGNVDGHLDEISYNSSTGHLTMNVYNLNWDYIAEYDGTLTVKDGQYTYTGTFSNGAKAGHFYMTGY